jgi:acyl-CoA dehydrogenase
VSATALGTLRSRLDEVVAVVRTHAEDCDRAARFPTEALEAMRRTGLLGLVVPEPDGGPGGTLADAVEACRALSREDLSVGLIYAMHVQQVAAVVRFASPELRARLLPRLGGGGVYVASVTTAPGTGGHLLTTSAGLSEAGGNLRIERIAPICTGGEHADAFLVTMLAPGATSPAEVSLVYADRDDLDVAVLGGWDASGMRATASVPLRLTGDVPAGNVVGEHGRFREIATTVFAPLVHLLWAACWVGAAAGALARTISYLRGKEGRERFDLASELLLTRLGRSRARIDATNAMLEHTRAAYERAADPTLPPVQLLLNNLKVVAAEESGKAVEDLVDLVGLRHGYLRDSPLALERAQRDLRAAPLNYHNDRLLLANGQLALLDRHVNLV